MEILRLPSAQPQAIINVSDPNTEYPYTVLDLSDASVTTGTITSNNSSKVTIPLSPLYDSEYRITIDEEENFVTVVRPYIDPNTLGHTQAEIEKFKRHEEIVRAIIDSIVTEGFYYKKRVIQTVGLGADYLPLWINAKKLIKIVENNVVLFDSGDPEEYSVQYGMSDDKTAVTILFDEQINRAEGAPLEFPQGTSDLWDLKFGYRGFPKGFDYTLYLEAGYKRVPSDIARAAELLIEDLDCGKLEYIERYVSEYQTDQFKIKFDGRVFEGTGNMVVDKILSKYAKAIRHIGVL
jgi:hypothetical protein